MRYLIPVAILIFGLNFSLIAQVVPASNAESTPEKSGYVLVWADEFKGEGAPDHRFWSFEHGFKRNQELQWYQPENARLEEGKLIIEGKRERVKNTAFQADSKDWRNSREFAEYTASSIHTRGKFSFQYGLVEVSAKIDTARGLWPAIWTLGIEKDWPANGEIDVMEYYLVEGEPTILANAAWAHESKRAMWDEAKIPFKEIIKEDPDWSNRFHTWKLDWTPEYLKIYLDDQLLNEVDLDRTLNPDGFNPFHQPHYLLLNLAIGGNGGDPTNSDFPRTYEVDYVRIYQVNKVDAVE